MTATPGFTAALDQARMETKAQLRKYEFAHGSTAAQFGPDTAAATTFRILTDDHSKGELAALLVVALAMLAPDAEVAA